MSARPFDIYKPKKYGNVRVSHDTELGSVSVIRVVLHNTEIFRYEYATNRVWLYTGGYKTVTTKRAMNTALSQIPGFDKYSVYQREGRWYINNMPYLDSYYILSGMNALNKD